MSHDESGILEGRSLHELRGGLSGLSLFISISTFRMSQTSIFLIKSNSLSIVMLDSYPSRQDVFLSYLRYDQVEIAIRMTLSLICVP